MSIPNVNDFFNADGTLKSLSEEEKAKIQKEKEAYDAIVGEVTGGRRWPGRSSRRRRRKSRRKSKRKKSKKKKRRRKRKRTKKRRRKRRR